MTLAKVLPLRKSAPGASADTPVGYKKVPAPADRIGDCALLLLDLNQQPFD